MTVYMNKISPMKYGLPSILSLKYFCNWVLVPILHTADCILLTVLFSLDLICEQKDDS